MMISSVDLVQHHASIFQYEQCSGAQDAGPFLKLETSVLLMNYAYKHDENSYNHF